MRRLSVLFVFVTACNSSSLTEEFCNRADTCNYLNTSVEECIEELDNELDKLSSSKQDEVKYEVQKCLDRPSCGGFRACVDDLDSRAGVDPGLATHGSVLDGE